MAPQDFIDTSYLLLPTRKRKQAVDEQFAHFVEMIEKIHVSVALMDVLHVHSYAKRHHQQQATIAIHRSYQADKRV